MLNKLVTLDLSYNQLRSIELTSTSIETLNLEGNRFTSIEFVTPIKNLVELNVRANNVVDLSHWRGFIIYEH